MSRLKGFNDLLSAILKIFGIIAIVAFIGFVGLSIYANVVEKDGITGLPDMTKAPYIVKLKTTGQALFTKDFNDLGNGRYTLYGFYNLEGTKWQWYDNYIILDEKYFGDIIIERRTE